MFVGALLNVPCISDTGPYAHLSDFQTRVSTVVAPKHIILIMGPTVPAPCHWQELWLDGPSRSKHVSTTADLHTITCLTAPSKSYKPNAGPGSAGKREGRAKAPCQTQVLQKHALECSPAAARGAQRTSLDTGHDTHPAMQEGVTGRCGRRGGHHYKHDPMAASRCAVYCAGRSRCLPV